MRADVWLQLALLITVAALPPTSFKRLLEKLSLFRAQLALLSHEVHRSWLSQWHSTLNFHALQYFVHRAGFFHLDSSMTDLVIRFTPERGPSPSLPLLAGSMKCCLQLPRMKPKWESSVRQRRTGKEGKQWRFCGNLKGWHDMVLISIPQEGASQKGPKAVPCVWNRARAKYQEQWSTPCTWLWWGHTSNPVLSFGLLTTKKILRH